MTTAATPTPTGKSNVNTLALLLVPVLLLAGVIALFVLTNGAGLNVTPAAPMETLQFERTMLRPGQIELHVRNTSPQEIRIAQININDAIWPYTISPGPVIPRLRGAVMLLNYPWVEAEAYEVTIFSSNSIPFATSIPVATATAGASLRTLWSFTLIGIYVGIIPVALGMFWLPALKRLGPHAMMFLMAGTVGLLIYLGIEATAEALEVGGTLGGAFQGKGIVGIGIIGTSLLLDVVSRRRTSLGGSEAEQRIALATMVAVGIGLHNLGEGLAIGAAYTVGAATLGTFLVIGFIIQNITEGLGIVVPILKDKPGPRFLALLAVIGGGPAIVGAWIGGLVYSQALSVLFLAVGAGAVFQVAYEIARQLIWKEMAKPKMPVTVFAGVLVGMLALYVTGAVIK
jgi:zinc transporter, ZIP family